MGLSLRCIGNTEPAGHASFMRQGLRSSADKQAHSAATLALHGMATVSLLAEPKRSCTFSCPELIALNPYLYPTPNPTPDPHPMRMRLFQWHSMALLSTFTLLAACSSTSQQKPVDLAPLRAFAARGYASVEQGAVRTSAHQWLLAGQPQRVLLMRPDHAGRMPLVVYMPGLGEAPEAGIEWRTAWARAGYAVLSVQPLAADLAAFQSDLAREGAFRALGQRHYAGEAVSRRMQALSELMTEARRRDLAGDLEWQGVDWTRVAVAGFDLGAYTAMTLAGERARGGPSPATQAAQAGQNALQSEQPLGLPVRAAIALSPYANISEGGMATRYAGIHMPVLSVTSEMDGDPLGLVAGAAQRTAPFEHADAPDQYLLSVQGLAHARLSGGPGNTAGAASAGGTRGDRRTAQAGGADDREAGDGSGDSGPGGSQGGASRGQGGGGGGDSGGGRRRSGGGMGGPGGGAGGPGGAGGAGGAGRDRSGAGSTAAGGLGATAAQLRIIAVQDVSTAFLDAYLREDAMAREWLRVDAPRWLGTAAELRRK